MPPAPIAVLLRNFRLMVQTSVPSVLHICLPAAALSSGYHSLAYCSQLGGPRPSLHLTKSLIVKDLIKSHLGHAAFPDYPMHSSPSSLLTSHKLLFMVLFEAYIFFLALRLLCTDLSFLLYCNTEGQECFRMWMCGPQTESALAIHSVTSYDLVCLWKK